MIKEDEIALMDFAACHFPYRPIDWRSFDKINENRKWYILEKWSSKGWIDYGTSIGSAWLTEFGFDAVTKPRVKP